ncbi:N-acetyl-gamma-glutamyl-phosphate reductase [Elusimicrobiota bacterium]
MNKKIKTSIVGASGFTGRELIKIIASHPGLEIDKLYSRSFAGKHISEIHPSLKGISDVELVEPSPQAISPESEIIFLALPHTKSIEYAAELVDKTRLIIDLSADYRFSDPVVYEKWYGIKHEDTANLKSAVYGIPEINREEVKGAQLIANPGCYATSVIIAIYPLVKEGIIDGPVYVDAKSGISGAGKKLDDQYIFSTRYENITPYNINSHRHMGEIVDFIGKVTGKDWDSLVFCPHLIPMERGILSNIYTRTAEKADEEAIREIFMKYYSNEHFINICNKGEFPQTKDVCFTNNCNIGIKVDPDSGDIIIIAAIDNLVKGASGQAIQNMNIVMGFEESSGLV